MIDDIVIEFDGRSYRWSCDFSIASDDDCWNWSDVKSFMTPPMAILEHLNHIFLERHANNLAAELEDEDLRRFYRIAKSMGANDEHFGQDELETMLEVAAPERLLEVRCRKLPPAAHTPINSPILRDWIFSSPGRTTPPNEVFSVGCTPFTYSDVGTFLLSRGVKAYDYAASWQTMSTLAELSKKFNLTYSVSNHFVLGREGFDENQLDEIIEYHRGRNLYLYSQEMFLTFLMTGADPFRAPSEVLVAFRAGHPALEAVSEGWSGWVSTFVSFDNHTPSTRRSGKLGDMEPESPLRVMGYRVGKEGLPSAQRQSILHAAFVGPLPKVGGEAYMSDWGEPKTAQRLRKIATAISTFCRNMKHRANSSDLAIEEWEDDLQWLREAYYHGRFTFSWPNTYAD